ncbi:alpha/beta fold hydrolase [Microbacterium sp. PMB16]|uniref:alpha/beta fold hydrolase n=1 Tax=Microbacterium sp. PMB16 TaxID=3120157 RepID=UPI003F4C4141
MINSSETILFISGAGLDAWIWDDVRDELSLPSVVAARPAEGRSSLSDYAEAAIASVGGGRFTIVAHSIGGVIAGEILRLVPERVSGLLALSAVVPRSGESFVSAMPFPNRVILPLALRLGGTRPPESAIRRGLGHGVDEAVVDRVVADFAPESRELYLDKARGHSWSGPTGYVVTTQDRELPEPLQRRFAHRLGGRPREELATGHLPMLQNSAETAASIRRFIAA